jgi:hypothetical protein
MTPKKKEDTIPHDVCYVLIDGYWIGGSLLEWEPIGH